MLKPVDYHEVNAAEQFVRSLRETGFGVLKNHPIPQALVESVYQHWQAFFCNELTDAHGGVVDKYAYRFGDKFDGYFPPDISETAKGASTKDIKEYFHFYHPWGCCPEELRDELLEYRAQANRLAAELLDWVEQHTPAEVSVNFAEPLSGMIRESDQTLLRILHYPPLQGDEPAGAVRAAAHEDINLLTILPAANEPGLQVLGKDGRWLDVPCDFGYLIINTGDMLQEASGGHFPSTTHRVINPANQENRSRISLPLFLHPRPEVVLSPRYTAGTYLEERLRELGF